MKKLTDSKKINLFIALCCAVYFISYLTRKNYDAALVEIYSSMGIAKTLASLASTGAVITYGAGQLLSGVLGDKFKPKNIILMGLLITACCNILLPVFSSNIYIMIGVWCVNGLAQAMIWPPLVKIMSDSLDNENYKRAVLYVTIASSMATVFVYLMIPICIKLTKWQIAFIFSSICAFVVCFIWTNSIRKFEKITGESQKALKKADEKSEFKIDKKTVFISGLIPISLGIILQGTLRDGVTTWMPSIVSEVFHLDTSVSILSTIALPVLGIFSATGASAVQRKMKNELSSAALFFFIALVSAVLLTAAGSKSLVLSIALMAIITACMHGVNLMLVCEVPNYFTKYNKVSTISGILNSFTYVGSAISIYGIAAISEKYNNWVINFSIWALIGIIGTAFCVITIKKWKIFRNNAET